MPEAATTVESEQQPAPQGTLNVLFVCRDNSVASIMAEALLARWGGSGFRAFSAGANSDQGIDPLAVALLKTCNVWREGLRPKSCDEFIKSNSPAMDFVFSLGGTPPAQAEMPSRWPGNPQVIHWRITEPLVNSAPGEKARSFKAAMRELETRIKLFVLVYQRETSRKFARAA